MDTEGFYAKLGLDPKASSDEIKRAYRKIALECHPDKVRTSLDKEGASERFKAVSHAYEILADPQSRARYDTPEQNTTFHCNVHDDFAWFFMTPPAVVCNIDCSLEELFKGTTKSIAIRTDSQAENINVKIPAGTPDDTQHLLKGKGQKICTPRGVIRGDLILTVKRSVHQIFDRRGDNLMYTHKITLKQALLGWRSVIKGLGGNDLSIGDNEISYHGKRLTFKGLGMPTISSTSNRDSSDSAGDLVVIIDVKFPDVLTASQRTALACCDGLD